MTNKLLQKSSTVDVSQGRALTAQDLQDAMDTINKNAGTVPPPLIMDQKSLDAYRNIFNNYISYKFDRGDWVFDGEQLYQVVGQNGPRVDVARLGDFRRGGILGVIDGGKLIKVPKGSTLETVKVLFGKVK